MGDDEHLERHELVATVDPYTDDPNGYSRSPAVSQPFCSSVASGFDSSAPETGLSATMGSLNDMC